VSLSIETIFFSSDATQKYSEDVLTVLAAPKGAVVQFRYESMYVSGEVQRAVGSQEIVGKEILIAFTTQAKDGERSMLPIRAAVVVAAKVIAGAYVFKLRVSWFPELSSWPLETEEVRARGTAEIEAVTRANTGFYTASGRSGGMRLEAGSADAEAWLEIARRLSTFEAFSTSFFVRSTLGTRSGRELPVVGEDGTITVNANAGFVLTCWFYGNDYHRTPRSLSVATDRSILTLSSDDSYEIQSRYDEIEFWFRSQQLVADSLTFVKLTLPGSSAHGDLATYLRFPVIVRRSRGAAITTGAIGGVGAALVGLPAVLGDSLPISLRISSAVLGALLLSFLAAWTARR
jgi:hypothetical protein